MARTPDPQQAARQLRYVSDEQLAGIAVAAHRASSPYKHSERKAEVQDAATLRRIRALVIPPAWKNVWIAPFANAHLAATGHDEQTVNSIAIIPASPQFATLTNTTIWRSSLPAFRPCAGN